MTVNDDRIWEPKAIIADGRDCNVRADIYRPVKFI